MPRLNDLEQVTQGYAVCWFGGSVTIANDHGVELRLSDNTLIAERSCSLAYGNGAGAWAAFMAGSAPVVFGAGFDIPGAGMPLENGCDPVGPDGSLIYKRLFNSYGPWGFRGGPDFGGDCRFAQNLGQHRAIWTEGDMLRGFGVTVPAVSCWWPRWKNGHLLYQSTETKELVLDGRVVAPAGNHYRPDFVVRGDGSVLVVSSPDAGESVTRSFQYTEVQFVALPSVQAAPVPPPVVVVPPPQPNPKPEPVMSIPDLSSVFAAAVLAHTDLMNRLRALAAEGNARNWPQEIQDQHMALRGQLLRYGAYACTRVDPSWGLLKKTGGSLGTRADGVTHATDILVYRPTMALVDVFDDYNPGWGPLDMSNPDNHRTPDFWIQPVPEGAPPPVDVPPPSQPPPPVVDLTARLDAIDRALGSVEAARQEEHAAMVLLAQAVEAIKTRPAPSASVDLSKIRIVGNTSRDYGHSHRSGFSLEWKS